MIDDELLDEKFYKKIDDELSMILAQVAGLVRVCGPDYWPEDAIPRDLVVDMAMRIKECVDRIREITR